MRLYPVLLDWQPASDDWMRERGFMEWACALCGDEVRVVWETSSPLADPAGADEAILPADRITDFWRLECRSGHRLLNCTDLAGDLTADTFDPPTTARIVRRLASIADVALWRAYSPLRPPFGNPEEPS